MTDDGGGLPGGISQADVSVETHRIVDADGSYDPEAVPDLSVDEHRDLYTWMLTQRIFDERAVKLQRRGDLGTYPSGRGQEASIVGSAYALEEDDWIYPAGRDAAACMVHGVSMADIIRFWRGIGDANRMAGSNTFPVTISIGSQLPLSVGVAWGMQLSGTEAVSVPYFGDGASSTGAFHEAVNFAGVLGVPAVFFCQNNGYSISVPVAGQTNAETIAQRAIGYGIDGIRVDGNDVLAVYEAVRHARERALDGHPVLVEARTYRLDAHTTSDDPTRYRTDEEVEEWRGRDPIDRYRAFLEGVGLRGEIDEAAIHAAVNERFDAAVEAADADPVRGVEEVFAHLYDDPPDELRDQREALERLLEARPDMMDYIEPRSKG